MPINISPNMSLPIPSVGQEPGPQYATDVNNCLTIVDSHNHNPGSGVQVTTSGLNINADLAFNNNNLTLLKSSRFQPQVSPLSGAMDLGCLYESGVDLYYNDGNGNQIRITSGGAIVGTAGSISGLAPPASASYNAGSQTFIWQSAANTPANMDFGAAIFRNMTANSKGVTVSPVAALGSNYSLVLPTIPGVENFLSLDTSGNITAKWNVDNTTINFTGNNIQVKPLGITGAQIANATITEAKIIPLTITTASISSSANIPGSKLSATANILRSQIESSNLQVSASCGSFLNLAGTTTLVTNLSVTITTRGKPVVIGLMSDGAGSDNLSAIYDTGSSASLAVSMNELLFLTSGGAPPGGGWRFPVTQAAIPAAAFQVVDKFNIGVPGTYLYEVQASSPANHTVNVVNMVLYAYEIC